MTADRGSCVPSVQWQSGRFWVRTVDCSICAPLTFSSVFCSSFYSVYIFFFLNVCFLYNCLKHFMNPKSGGCNVLVQFGGWYAASTFFVDDVSCGWAEKLFRINKAFLPGYMQENHTTGNNGWMFHCSCLLGTVWTVFWTSLWVWFISLQCHSRDEGFLVKLRCTVKWKWAHSHLFVIFSYI